MGFHKRLKILGLLMGVLPLAVAVVVALYPVPSAHALKTASVPTEINYDDPNMATTEGYVAEASITCIKQGGENGNDVHSCMRGYGKSADDADKTEAKTVAQKKDDAPSEASSPSSSAAGESK